MGDTMGNGEVGWFECFRAVEPDQTVSLLPRRLSCPSCKHPVRTAVADDGGRVCTDTIWNHMSGLDSGTGYAGSSFTKYNYPGIYQNQDFHSCRHGINNWNNATEVQTCELAGLAE